MADHYYIEFTQVENQIKVTAIDPDSGKEATVICPSGTARKDMTDLALRKLQYILKKTKHEP